MFNITWFYVGAIYAVAVWLARRSGISLPRRVAVFFYLMVLVSLWGALTSDRVNLPADFLRSLPPWSFLTRLHQPVNADINDLVLQIAPWAHQVRESWRSGHVPLWNHLSGSGYPLLAAAQSCALSPLRLLALPLPLGQSFAAEAAMKTLIAMTFMFLFCRRHYSEMASVAAAASFGFCSFLVVWRHFPLATVASFVPAALYGIDLLAERRSHARFVFVAGLWTAMILGGHPETVAHIFFISLLYTAWITLVARPSGGERHRRRFILALGGALAVAGLLSMPFLAPFAEALTKSRRYSELQVSPNVIGYYSDRASAMLLLQPRLFGALPFEKPWNSAPSAESITGFAGLLGVAGCLALAIGAIRSRSWRSRELFFVAATLIVLGIAFGWPGISQLFHMVFKLAANARLRLLLCFLLSVQTAAMIDLLGRDRRAYLAGLAALAVLIALVYGTGVPEGAPRTTAIVALLPSIVVLTLAALRAVLREGLVRHAVTLLLLTAIVAEVRSATAGWNPTLRQEEMYPATPLIEKLQALAGRQPQSEPLRIVGTGPVLFPNTSAIFGLEDIRAHDPMSNARYLGVLRVLTGYETEDYFPKWQNLHTPVLDFLNVQYVITGPQGDPHDAQRYSLEYEGRDGRIFRNHEVLPRFFPIRNVILEFNGARYLHLLQKHTDWAHTALVKSLPVKSDQMRLDLLAPRAKGSADATLRIVQGTGDDFRMTGNAPRFTFIASSIPYWPGWKIENHGEKLAPLHVNGAFLGFVVPPGPLDLHVWYSPVTFWGGVWVAAAALIGICGSAVLVRRRPLG